MKKIITNKKGKIILFLTIGFIMIGIVYVHLLSRNIEIKINNVNVGSLQSNNEVGFKYYFNGSYTEWGVNADENQNIISNSQDYRIVNYNIDVLNNTKFVTLNAKHCTPTWRDEIQDIIVGYFDSDRYKESQYIYGPDKLINKRFINIILKLRTLKYNFNP